MARYAQLKNGIVDNVIEADSDPDGINGEWVACGNAGPGYTFDGTSFHAPVPPADPRLWWVDQGPFVDRFDTLGFAGLKGMVLALGRTNDVVYAAFADMSIRKYIDLLGRRAELLATLNAIAAQVATAYPVAPAFTPAMRAAVLDTATTEAERHIKGVAP